MFNPDDEILDYLLVRELLDEVGTRSAQVIIDRLTRGGEEWTNRRLPADDVTLVALKVTA